MTTSNTGPMKVRSYFQTITIIHSALIVGPLLFAIAAYYLVSTSNQVHSSSEEDQIFLIIVPLFALGAIIGGMFLAKQQLEATKQKESLREKLSGYQTILIIKSALLEGSAFFAIAAYLITESTVYMGIAAILILLLFMNRPTALKIITELELNQKEREVLENPDATIEG